MGKFHSTAHFRCNFDEAFAGGAPAPKTFKSILNSAYNEAKRQIELAKFHNDRKAIKVWQDKLAQAHEQLRILKAFDSRIVRLMERVAIRNFREQTRKMKVQS